MDEAGRSGHLAGRPERLDWLGVPTPRPDAVLGIDDLSRELGRLRRRHATATGLSRPLGIDHLARRCGVPRSTLHTYLSGAVLPPAPALDAIVLALGCDAAECREWAAAVERVVETRHAGRLRGAASPSTPLSRLSAEVDRRMDRPTDRLAASLRVAALLERVVIGTDRQPRRATTRVTVRATEDGVDRYLLRIFPPPEVELDALRLVEHAGCRDGVHRSFEDLRARVLEVVFDTALRRGEAHIFSFTLEQGAARQDCEPARQMLKIFRRRGPAYGLEIAFPRGDLPVDVRQVHIPHASAADSGSIPLRLSADGVAQMAVDQPSAGMHGIRWRWCDAG